TPKESAARWEKVAHRYEMPCNEDIWKENPIASSYNASIAVKAAELQGKQPGLRFLRRLREAFFLNKKNITEEAVLLECACEADLDMTEFRRDMQAHCAVRAFQSDLKTMTEMEVEQL